MSRPLPGFDADGNLPPQVYQATLGEVLARFGGPTPQRQQLGERLRRLFQLAKSTGKVERFILFGSFVTGKPAPRDLDMFLLMSDDFQIDSLTGDTAVLFDHPQAEVRLGVSFFWLRPLTCLDGVERAIADWQITREGTLRGIVEIIGGEP